MKSDVILGEEISPRYTKVRANYSQKSSTNLLSFVEDGGILKLIKNLSTISRFPEICPVNI